MIENKSSSIDSRIKRKYFPWIEYLFTYLILLVLSAGQFMIFYEYVDLENAPPAFIAGMLGYWGIVTLVFFIITTTQKNKRYDMPLKRLSNAAENVASGDFSVYLETVHSPDKYDYIDVLFEDFNKMVEELGTIETLKNDFISNVSHEIKSPLSVIQSYATALQKHDLSEAERSDYTETIITASKRLTELVSNILRLNKLENQEIRPAAESFDLCRQLCECALNFEDILDLKKIRLETSIEERCIINADKTILELVWNNLFSNAVKFTDEHGVIKLTQVSFDEHVEISISDNGCGMDEKTLSHIFDKFYQGDSSRSQEGNGLGLSLVYRVIEIINGTITVQSELNKGSTFMISINR